MQQLAIFLIVLALPCTISQNRRFFESLGADAFRIGKFDVDFVAEIRNLETSNDVGAVQHFFRQLVNVNLAKIQKNYSTTAFLTVRVYACNESYTFRLSKVTGDLVTKAFENIKHTNHFNECQPVGEEFSSPNHEFSMEYPRIRVQLVQLLSERIEWTDTAKKMAKRVVNTYPPPANITTEILLVVNNYSLGQIDSDLRMALFLKQREDAFWSLSGDTANATVANAWNLLANATTQAFKEHIDFCEYVRERAEVCSFDAKGACGRMQMAVANISDHRPYCRENEYLVPVCLEAIPTAAFNMTEFKTKEAAICFDACSVQTTWSACNASCYQRAIVSGPDRLYRYCPGRSEVWVEKCPCPLMPAWQIAVITIVIVVGVAVIVGVPVYFLVIQPRRAAAAAMSSSDSSDDEGKTPQGPISKVASKKGKGK